MEYEQMIKELRKWINIKKKTKTKHITNKEKETKNSQ
jgi:hypothetical protein